MNREQFQLKQQLVYCERVLSPGIDGGHAARRQCPLPPYMALVTKNDGAASEQNLPHPAPASNWKSGGNPLDF
jgi:hypothetical protein